MMYYYPARLGFDRALAARLLAIAWPMAAIEFIVIAYSRGSYCGPLRRFIAGYIARSSSDFALCSGNFG